MPGRAPTSTLRHVTAAVAAGTLLILAVAPPGVRAQVRVGGWADYQGIVYWTAQGDRARFGRNQLRLQPEVNADVGGSLHLFAAVELRGDAAKAERNRVYLDEAYLDLYLGPVDVRVGRQILAWGRADAVNPTDYFGARDYTDVLDADEERLGQTAVRAIAYAGRWSVAGVFAPDVQRSPLPVPGSRWWPETADDAADGGGSAMRTVLGEPRTSVGGDAAWGVRVSATMSGVDVGLSAFRGPWHLPVLLLGAVYLDPVGGGLAMDVVPAYARIDAVGADLATVVGPVGLHAEGAAYLTDEDGPDAPALDDPFARIVVGADYTTRLPPLGREVLLLAEWSQDVRVADGGRPWPAEDLNHVFRHALFLRASAALGDFSTLALEGFYDPGDAGRLLRVASTWKPRDGLEVRLSLDLPGGPSGSFFGTYRDNGRVHARVKASF